MQKMSSKTTGSMNRPESECELQEQLLSDEGCTLMLYNDNTNTFDFVIDSLMECCGHSYEQALQCTWIAHCFGKCDVKHGGYERLAPIAEKLTLRGLTVKII